MPRKNPYLFERYDQKLVVFLFYGVFMIYCPLFWGSREIYNDLRPDTCLTVITKNSSFSCFIFIFTNYCPHFCVPEGFTCLIRTLTCFQRYDQKLVVFAFMAILMSYSPQFLGSCWICNAYKTRYMFEI